ncbi:uncharacterized protein LOC143290310 [Babylonia areolata]|uniref:uncharacterized protein LOC143290310 n=1 Tax=Babylonia areolata TaxID=304850 RepID=UPI003FD0C6AC
MTQTVQVKTLLESYPQYWVGYFIYYHFLVIIPIVGFPGNFLRSSIYVAALAVTDTLCLTDKIVFMHVERYNLDVGAIGCKLLFFTASLLAMYASWLVVLMTVERFLAVWLPLKVGTLCTDRTLALALALPLSLVTSLSLTYFAFIDGFWRNGQFRCLYKPEYRHFRDTVWYWVDGVLYALLPCVLLIVFNTLIVVGVKRAANIQRQLTEGPSLRNEQVKVQMVEQLRQQRQITVMLMAMSMVFVILTIPNCAYFLFKPYWKIDNTDIEGIANFLCVQQLVHFLTDASHAVNFFVYFISTRKFRHDFRDVICSCRKWKHRSSCPCDVGSHGSKL